jgi:hypothetical protein
VNPESISSMLFGQLRYMSILLIPSLIRYGADVCAHYVYYCYTYGFIHFNMALLHLL